MITFRQRVQANREEQEKKFIKKLPGALLEITLSGIAIVLGIAIFYVATGEVKIYG